MVVSKRRRVTMQEMELTKHVETLIGPMAKQLEEARARIAGALPGMMITIKRVKGWSGRRMARELGISPGYQSDIEYGKHVPAERVMGRIAELWLEALAERAAAEAAGDVERERVERIKEGAA